MNIHIFSQSVKIVVNVMYIIWKLQIVKHIRLLSSNWSTQLIRNAWIPSFFPLLRQVFSREWVHFIMENCHSIDHTESLLITINIDLVPKGLTIGGLWHLWPCQHSAKNVDFRSPLCINIDSTRPPHAISRSSILNQYWFPNRPWFRTKGVDRKWSLTMSTMDMSILNSRSL